MPYLSTVRPLLPSQPQSTISASIRPLSVCVKQALASSSLRRPEQGHHHASSFPTTAPLRFQTVRYYKGPARHRFRPRPENLVQYKSDGHRQSALDKVSRQRVQRERKDNALDEWDTSSGEGGSIAMDYKQRAIEREDLGVMPGTPIIVTRSDWPSLWSSPRARLKMEWVLFKTLFKERYSLFYMKATRGFANFFRMSLSRKEAKQAAVALHYQMNQAIAEGNPEALKDLALEGLKYDIRSHIGRRKPGTNYRWQRENVRADVISYRAIPLPKEYSDSDNNQNWLRQIVVRIRSQQVLVEQRWQDLAAVSQPGRARIKGPVRGAQPDALQDQGGGSDGSVDAAEAERARELELMLSEEDEREARSGEYDELVVAQRRQSPLDEGAWKIWGTTTETPIEEWRTIEDPEGYYVNRNSA